VFTQKLEWYSKEVILDVCQVNYSIKEICFNLDESMFAVLSSDNYVRIWNNKWTLVHDFKNLKLDITTICLLNSGEII